MGHLSDNGGLSEVSDKWGVRQISVRQTGMCQTGYYVCGQEMSDRVVMARISVRVSDTLKKRCDEVGPERVRQVLTDGLLRGEVGDGVGRAPSGDLGVACSAVSPAAPVGASEDAAAPAHATLPPTEGVASGAGYVNDDGEFYSPREGVAGHGERTGFDEAPDWAGPYGEDEVDRPVEEADAPARTFPVNAKFKVMSLTEEQIEAKRKFLEEMKSKKA